MIAPTEPPPPETPTPEAPHRRSRKPLLVVGVIVVAIAAAAGIAIATGGDGGGHTLRGEFTLTDSEGFIGDGRSCFGDGGYSDFGPGMNVVVRNGAGETLATTDTHALNDEHLQFMADNNVVPFVGFLPPAAEEEADESTEPGDLEELFGVLGGCTVVFDVDIPASDFYAIEIGRRGDLTYSAQELEDAGYYVVLSLGD